MAGWSTQGGGHQTAAGAVVGEADSGRRTAVPAVWAAEAAARTLRRDRADPQVRAANIQLQFQCAGA